MCTELTSRSRALAEVNGKNHQGRGRARRVGPSHQGRRRIPGSHQRQARALTKQRLTPDQTERSPSSCINSDEDRAAIDKLRDFDCSWGMPGVGRFRVNVLRQRSSFMIVMRVIPFTVPTIESLKLPAVLKQVAESDRGLVLVTGSAAAERARPSRRWCITSISRSTSTWSRSKTPSNSCTGTSTARSPSARWAWTPTDSPRGCGRRCVRIPT